MLSVRHPLNAECAAGESSLLYALPVPSNPSSTTLKCIDLLGQSVQRHFTLATLSHGIRQIETSSIGTVFRPFQLERWGFVTLTKF